MKSLLKRNGALLVLLLFALAAFAPSPAVTLRLNLQEGTSHKMFVQIDQEINQVVMGQEQNIKNNIGMGYRFDVLSANDGVFEVKMTYYKVTFTQEGPMGTITYDSENPAENLPMQARGFAGLLGQSLTLKLDAQGKVHEVQGVDEMISKMLEQFSQVDDATRAQIENSLRQQFGTEAMSSQMESMFAIYPDGEVAVGDTWTREVQVNAGLPLKLVTTYRLDALDGNKAALAIEGSIQPGTEGPVEMGGMQIEFDISGVQKGTATMDVDTGLIVASESSQEVSGDMLVNDGAMTWPIVLKTNTRLTMEE